ncbi:hypothetical protein AKJ16_DCAP03847 [Drosera capensis]
MDEDEFQRLLSLFPIVRSRDYKADAESSGQSSLRTSNVELKELQNSSGTVDKNESETADAFWGKLKLAAEKKVGAADAQKFLNAFQHVYDKLLDEAVRRKRTS